MVYSILYGAINGQMLMACDFYRLPHLKIQTLSPYIPGKPAIELAKDYGLSEIIKLASNENPLGCSHKAIEALSKLSGHDIAAYPSPKNSLLLTEIAQKLKVSEEMITLGNGSDTLFPLLMNCFALNQDKHILVHQYGFSSYPIYANILGIPVITTPVLEDYKVDINEMIACANKKTALIFIANPNNPTGASISQIDIEKLLKKIPESTLLVIDEAYHEYHTLKNEPNIIQLLDTYKNLVITRTFSKAYGLAGLRIGYAIAAPEISELLFRISPPFAVNQAAMSAAIAALSDTRFINETLRMNQKGKKQLQEGFYELNIDWFPSTGNFIMINLRTDTGFLYHRLLENGIIIRPLHPYGLDSCLRITIGTVQQNLRFLDTLKYCLDNQL